MRMHVGTSGYSYKEWKPAFYPQELASTAMLRFYAERLDTVEINNTFYRMPSKKVLQGWCAEVPPFFRFAVKATRRVTHFKRLRDVGSELDFLFGNLAALEGRLGPVLFQLPPNLGIDMPLLQDFLAQVPPHIQSVLEFREPSWFDDTVFSLLRQNGVALCAMEEEEAEARVVPTTNFGYFRLRRERYSAAELESWVDRIRAQPWDETFVYFKHDTAAPNLALDFVRATRGE